MRADQGASTKRKVSRKISHLAARPRLKMTEENSRTTGKISVTGRVSVARPRKNPARTKSQRLRRPTPYTQNIIAAVSRKVNRVSDSSRPV